MILHPYEVALALAIGLLAVEMLTGALFFLSFSIGMFLVAGAEFFWSDFSLGRDVFLFVAGAFVPFIGLRVFFRGKGDSKVVDGDVNEY
jgi:membrane protein implicated in regulation of membrane protease activity